MLCDHCRGIVMPRSLIFMSTHKATAARCLRSTAVRVTTLRRLALSVLFIIRSTRLLATRPLVPSPREPSIKGNTPMVDTELSLTHTPTPLRHGGSSDTALKEEYRVDVSQCQLLEKKAGEGKAAKAARHLFGPPAAPVQGKNLGSDQPGERLVHAATLCSSPTGKAARTTASKGPS